MKEVLIIDGQGGRLGALLVSALKEKAPTAHLIAVGTNALATAAMLKAGAEQGATGENPVLVGCRTADVIVGPLGIVIADSLMGEVTPTMAVAIGQSRAEKILLPLGRCHNQVVGQSELPLPELVRLAAEQIALLL